MGSVQSSSCKTSFVQSNSCQGSSPSPVPERGEYNVDKYNVDPYLKQLAADGVVITVLEIAHYRQPFQRSMGGSDLLHDFVGLRLRVGRREKFIKAEKSEVEIKISIVESFATNGAEIKHGPVGVEDCGEIGMQDLLLILKEHSPDYSLLCDNCWKYADSTFRRLIRNFSAHPTISPERRSELEGFLNHPPPTMPNNVLLRCGLLVIGCVVIIAGLGFVAYIGASVLAELFPPEQLAQFFVTLNFLQHTSAPLAQGGMRTIAGIQAAALAALYQIFSVPQTRQLIAAALSQPQAMLRALSPPLSHAAGVTRRKILAVVAAKLVTVGKLVAVKVSHFFWPIVSTVGVVGALILLYLLLTLALEATPWGQQLLKKLRAFLPRRRTGPSMPLL